MTPLKDRERKRQWAWANPDKVRYANKRWRDANLERTRRQAKERMRRLRARRRPKSVFA